MVAFNKFLIYGMSINMILFFIKESLCSLILPSGKRLMLKNRRKSEYKSMKDKTDFFVHKNNCYIIMYCLFYLSDQIIKKSSSCVCNSVCRKKTRSWKIKKASFICDTETINTSVRKCSFHFSSIRWRNSFFLVK